MADTRGCEELKQSLTNLSGVVEERGCREVFFSEIS